MLGISKENYNKFDIYTFLLIVSLIGGNYGGALTLSRLLSILLIPALLRNINQIDQSYYNSVKNFFIFWFVYGLISLAWTPDLNEGLKEAVYYPVHFAYFIEIFVFSLLGKSPFKNISVSWGIALALTLVVATWEITTGNHLSNSKFDDELGINYYGTIIYHNFAAMSFGNYNSYVVFICFCLPFVLYNYLTVKTFSIKLITIVSLPLVIWVLFTNASRGGLLSAAIVFCIWLYFILKSPIANNKFRIVAVVALIIAGLVYFWDTLSYYIMLRTDGGANMNDEGRWEIWRRGFQVFANTYGLGCGMGGLVSAMSGIHSSSAVLATHNAFIELLAQYGCLISLPIIVFLYLLVKKMISCIDTNNKFLLLASLCMLPSVLIVNSGYLLQEYLYAFFSSIFVFSLSNCIKTNV